MRKLSLLMLACIGCTSLLPSFTYASNRANTLTFTLGGGYDFFASKRQIKNTGIPFVGVGYNFTDRWGVEGLLGLFSTHFKPSVQDTRLINGSLFAVDAVYRFLPHRLIEPYVLAGVGAMSLNPNQNEAHTEGNINAGVGTEFFIDRSIAFRLEARDFYTIIGGKNDVMLDGGVTFLLDMC